MDIGGLDHLVPEVEGKGDDQVADLGDNCEGMMMNECRKTIQFIHVADGCSGPNVADQLLRRLWSPTWLRALANHLAAASPLISIDTAHKAASSPHQHFGARARSVGRFCAGQLALHVAPTMRGCSASTASPSDSKLRSQTRECATARGRPTPLARKRVGVACNNLAATPPRTQTWGVRATVRGHPSPTPLLLANAWGVHATNRPQPPPRHPLARKRGVCVQ
jgi:hypothetical protein